MKTGPTPANWPFTASFRPGRRIMASITRLGLFSMVDKCYFPFIEKKDRMKKEKLMSGKYKL